MVKEITKAQVIKALRTEPLKPGRFFHRADPTDGAVCAVGAVMRQTSCVAWAKENGVHLNTLAKRLTWGDYSRSNPVSPAKAGNYLGALSSYFEKYYERKRKQEGARAARKMMVDFVEKHFPEVLSVTLIISGMSLIVEVEAK